MEPTEVAGKRVAVLGGGIEGAASARWLVAQGAEVTIHDAAEAESLPANVELEALGVTFVNGARYLDDLAGYDLIVRSPGVPFLNPAVQAAITADVLVTSQTKLFWERCPVPIVGITGTKGKGTTATLLRDMLQAVGKTVHLGGNIGTPPLEFLDQIGSEDTVILELSSFQLQDLDRSPQLAIITNLGEDHLDHHADPDEYAAAKANILKHQSANDWAILNADDPGSRQYDSTGAGRRAWFGRSTHEAPAVTFDEGHDAVSFVPESGEPKPILTTSDIPVPGPHNLSNVMAAALAASLLGGSAEDIKRAVAAFKPLPYHLEPLGTVDDVTYVNDSYSTGPTSAIPALESFEGPVVLVAGGSDKGLDYSQLAEEICDRCRAVILIPPAGNRIEEAINRQPQDVRPQLVRVSDKSEIFPALQDLVRSGDTVLLSPAAASFGWFDGYRDRGAWFSEQVAALGESD